MPRRLRDLEAIIHPAVRPRILAAIAAAEADGAAGVVIEAIKLRRGRARRACATRSGSSPATRPSSASASSVGGGAEPEDAEHRIAAQAGLIERRPARRRRGSSTPPRIAATTRRAGRRRRRVEAVGLTTHSERLFSIAHERVRSHCRLTRMPDFKFVAPFEPTGDQPEAIERLTDGLAKGVRHQTLLGATGTGKTATLAWTIAAAQQADARPRPQQDPRRAALRRVPRVLPGEHGRVLRQLLRLLPARGVPARARDTYIEKDSSRNDEIDRLRHAATHALFERRDVIIVASVTCIYGLGAPVDYGATVLKLRVGGQYRRDAVLRHLVDLQYQRNDRR